MSNAAPTVYDPEHPPLRTRPTGIEPGYYSVEQGHGMTIYLREHEALQAAKQGREGFELLAPMTTSELSGNPGYFVRTEWVELALTAEEMVRFFLGRLSTREVSTLVARHGVFQEIHDAYHPATWIALAPKYTYSEEFEHDKLHAQPHVLVLRQAHGPRAHSIVSIKQGLALVPAIAREYRREGLVVALHAPEKGAELDPFENIIALNVHKDGEIRAYGPFDNSEDAEVYRPANRHSSPIDLICMAVVSSTFVDPPLA